MRPLDHEATFFARGWHWSCGRVRWGLMASVMLVTSAARAEETCPELAAARKAWAKVDFVATSRAIDDCLSFEGNPRSVLIELYEMQGIIAASRRQNEAAREAFRRLLALEPNHALADLSPRIATPYLEARAQAATDGALALQQGETVADGTTVSLSLAVTGNALGLAETVLLHARPDGGKWRTFEAPSSTPRFKVVATKLEWWAELLSKKRSQLLVMGSEASPQTEAPAAPAPPPPRPPVPLVAASADAPAAGLSSLRLAGTSLGAAGVIAFAVGAVFGRFSVGLREQYNSSWMTISRAQAYALQAESQRDAVLANVLMIGGGLLAATGAVLWLIEPVRAVSVSFVPSAGGVAIAGRWP